MVQSSMGSRVSAVIPAYNAESYLADAIESALAQTLPPYEIIVVDDGSRDGTARVCDKYQGRIVAISQENQGEAGARNTALRVATGDFIALLDADDTCSADRFELQVRALQAHPDAVACYSGHWVFSDAGVTGHFAGDPDRAGASAELFAADLLVHPITMMFRRERALGVEFPVGVYTGGDMIFSGLLRRLGPVVILREELYGYRRHDLQITARGHDLDSLRYRLAWLRENRSRIWPDLDVQMWEEIAWHSMSRWLRGHYWARRRTEFLRLRRVLREQWPAHVQRTAELDLLWYPDWIWWSKGLLDRWTRGST